MGCQAPRCLLRPAARAHAIRRRRAASRCRSAAGNRSKVMPWAARRRGPGQHDGVDGQAVAVQQQRDPRFASRAAASRRRLMGKRAFLCHSILQYDDAGASHRASRVIAIGGAQRTTASSTARAPGAGMRIAGAAGIVEGTRSMSARPRAEWRNPAAAAIAGRRGITAQAREAVPVPPGCPPPAPKHRRRCTRRDRPTSARQAFQHGGALLDQGLATRSAVGGGTAGTSAGADGDGQRNAGRDGQLAFVVFTGAAAAPPPEPM